MKGVRIMNFDMTYEISELKNTILTCKAIAGSFHNEFVAGNLEANITALRANEERHTYLYKALVDALYDAAQQAAALEGKADAAYQKQTQEQAARPGV